MKILPVLDIKDGLVVRGVGGRRDEYRPIVSRLTPSSQPTEVARAFRDRFGLAELYLADLDAIAGAAPALAVCEAVRELGCRLWVDAGVREVRRAGLLAAAGIERVVAGLETLEGPEDLRNICRAVGTERVVFSLDLKDGKPLAGARDWGADPLAITEQAIALGVRRLIVLDLARVGTGMGTGTEGLCAWISQAYPDVEVVAGGGVRSPADLRRLQACGVRGVLVASALHDGLIDPRRDCLAFSRPG